MVHDISSTTNKVPNLFPNDGVRYVSVIKYKIQASIMEKNIEYT